MKNNKLDKKMIIIISVIIVMIIVTVLLVLFKLPKKNEISTKAGIAGVLTTKVKIKESEAKSLKLVDYDSTNFSMKIPEGWKVEVGGVDMFYAIKVFNPLDERYQIFAILKAEPLLKNDKAKAWYENYYNRFKMEKDRLLAESIVIYNPTVEAFYSNFNDYAKFCKSIEPTYSTFTFPCLKNFAMVESFESNTSLKNIAKEDKTLRGNFQDSQGKNGEGLFMASMIDIGSNMMLGYDVYWYTAYNIMGITTPENELVNYQDILAQSINSLKYKDSFTQTTIANGNERTKNALTINASIQEAFNSYNNAWTNRQKTYDITSQKYSDATLGYERVYDTETGDIYKAYNGFTDDYSGERYKVVTDDMYTKSISGYIEK